MTFCKNINIYSKINDENVCYGYKEKTKIGSGLRIKFKTMLNFLGLKEVV